MLITCWAATVGAEIPCPPVMARTIDAGRLSHRTRWEPRAVVRRDP